MRGVNAAVVVAALFFVGCDTISGGGLTPEAVMQRAEAARKSGDWHTYVDCHTDESQAVIVEKNVEKMRLMQSGRKLAELGARAVAQLDQQLKPLKDIVVKHGITEGDLDQLDELKSEPEKQQAIRSIAAKVSDKRGFVAEMLAYEWKAITKGAKVEEAASTIKSVKIEGDRATATVAASVSGGPAMEIPVELKRTSSGWKIDQTRLLQ